MRFFEERLKIVQRSVNRIDGIIICDVVPVVLERRRIEGQEPNGGDTEIVQVIEPLSEAAKIANSIGVAVRKGADVDLVDNGVLVPEPVFFRGDRVHSST